MTLEDTWEIYASAWKAVSADEKRSLFEKSLAIECTYTDPVSATSNWDKLVDAMLGFHKQVPGGHFVTTRFMSHNRRSIAVWNMCDADGHVMSDGVSFGEYDNNGKLVSITGFYEVSSP